MTSTALGASGPISVAVSPQQSAVDKLCLLGRQGALIILPLMLVLPECSICFVVRCHVEFDCRPMETYTAHHFDRHNSPHHQIMVDGVEGSSQVKQAEHGNVSIVSSEQKVVVNLHDGGLSTVEPAIR